MCRPGSCYELQCRLIAKGNYPERWGGDWDRDGQLKDHRFIDYPHFELVQR